MKKAFTLAEILITLLVIGIVSSLVIPAILQDTQEQEYYIGTKKAMSILQNALDKLVADGSDFSFYEVGHNSMDIRQEFGTVLSYSKIGPMSQIFPNGARYYYYKSTKISVLPDYASAVLNNGQLIRFGDVPNGCTAKSPSGTLANICADVLFDINGYKGPNMFGKDLHYFFVVKRGSRYKAYPLGSNNDGYTCVSGSTTSTTSKGCAMYRISDWAMPQ